MSGSRRMAALVATFSVACSLLGAGTASAATVVPCSTRVTSTPFAKWGDSTPYFLMPDGGFEAGGAGWGMAGGSSVVLGNESYKVNASTDAHSVAIPTGSSVTSPTLCLGRGELMFRMFVKAPAVTGASLKVQATLQNPTTGLVSSSTFTISSSSTSAWAPSNKFYVPNLLGGVLGTENLTVKVTPSGTAGTWYVDDVYVDPLKVR